jgi:hypothetical protein
MRNSTLFKKPIPKKETILLVGGYNTERSFESLEKGT